MYLPSLVFGFLPIDKVESLSFHLAIDKGTSYASPIIDRSMTIKLASEDAW